MYMRKRMPKQLTDVKLSAKSHAIPVFSDGLQM